jgi:hypothetical protein
MGKKEKEETERKKIQQNVTAVSAGKTNSQDKEGNNKAAEGPTLTNALASLEAVLSEVQAPQQNWPQ